MNPTDSGGRPPARTPDDREPRIPRHEVAKLLGEAAELAVRSEGRRDDSVRLGDLEAAAAEAGIDPSFVRAALEARGRGTGRAADIVLGPPATWVAEGRFPGRVHAGEACRMIAEIQVVAGIPGGTVEEHEGGVWRLTSGSKGHVQVTSDGEEVAVAMVADRGLRRIALLGGGFGAGGLLGSQIGGFLTISSASPEAMAAGILTGGILGAVGGALGGRVFWKMAAERWKARANAALDRVRDVIPRLPSGTAADPADPGDRSGP